MRPLLKWAGGKRQLLTTLRPHFPTGFTRYIEPFLGSGAVFFDLHGSGTLHGRPARLADGNTDLIGCYEMVRDRTEEVIAALESLAGEHRAGGDAFYYEVRDGRFNALRQQQTPYTPDLAAMLIFLNRTGFNGLFRLNRRGAFNVPVGRYVNPTICDAPHIRAVAAALGSPRVSLAQQGFAESLAEAGRGDFVYCDPPYAPLSPTSSFASYTAGGFNLLDQQALQEAVVAAVHRGANVVLSNSSAPAIERLYTARSAREAGLVLHRVDVRRAINSRSSRRGPVAEFVVSNRLTQPLPAKAGPMVKMLKPRRGPRAVSTAHRKRA